MNTFAVSLAFAALLVFSTNASPCGDICNAECALSLQACSFTGSLGDICQQENAVCTQGCAAACGCVDDCAATCTTAFNDCKGDGADVIKYETCALNFEACEAQCNVQCEFKNVAAAVQGFNHK